VTSSLWRTPSTGGGPETKVLDAIANIRAFFLVEDGIYFISPWEGGGATLNFADFNGRNVRRVVKLAKAPSFGLSAFPATSGVPRTILYSQTDQQGTDLMMLEVAK